MNTALGRIPPHNSDAEKAVLAAMIIDKDAVYEVIPVIKAEDFYTVAHGIIYDTILEMTDQGETVDLLTLTEGLRKRDLLEKAGGLSYVAEVSGAAGSSVGVLEYAGIIKEKSLLRILIKTAGDIYARGYEVSEDPENILNDAEKMLVEISQRRIKDGLVPMSDIIGPTIDRLEKLAENRSDVTGIPSGFIDLDKKTSGWQGSDLVIVAARPGMGKTSFCLNIGQNAAESNGTSVAIFSLEMSREQLVQRIISSKAMINQQKLRTGKLSEGEWVTLSEIIGPLSGSPVYIDDTPGITVREIRSKCRRLKAEKGLDLVIIDYLQLMSGSGRSESRQQEVSEISRSLKGLARELEIPVIALSQLSRAAEQNPEKRPNLSHLRESGAIEQDADIVLFIYREDVYNKEVEIPGVAEIIIAKHRNGPVGTVKLGFQEEYTRFTNIEIDRSET